MERRVAGLMEKVKQIDVGCRTNTRLFSFLPRFSRLVMALALMDGP
jgi:hypothetical protein